MSVPALLAGLVLLAVFALTGAVPTYAVRRDIPWTVVVRATSSANAGANSACPPALAPFIERGARCTVETTPGGALVIAEGPPELEPDLTRAVRGPGPVFTEGRSPPASAGSAGGSVAPAPAARTGRALDVSADSTVLPLAPTASLFDVEGGALVALVHKALPALKDADVSLAFAPGRAALVVRAPVDQVSAALAPFADKPLSPSLVADLELRARSALAERRARIGAWAKDAARAWLVCGDACVPSSVVGGSTPLALLSAPPGTNGELGARLRARLLVSALKGPSAPSAPAPRG